MLLFPNPFRLNHVHLTSPDTPCISSFGFEGENSRVNNGFMGSTTDSWGIMRAFLLFSNSERPTSREDAMLIVYGGALWAPEDLSRPSGAGVGELKNGRLPWFLLAQFPPENAIGVLCALEPECRCRCRVTLQGAFARCPWPCVLWSWGAGAAAACRCRVLLLPTLSFCYQAIGVLTSQWCGSGWAFWFCRCCCRAGAGSSGSAFRFASCQG